MVPYWLKPNITYRWRIAVLILLLLCIVGIPGTWLLIERTYVVTGAVRIAPVTLSPKSVSPALSLYKSFMHAQSEIITSNQVIERVADDLADKNLTFFEDRESGFIAKLRWRLKYKGIQPEPTTVLKQAILDKIITAKPAIKEELIKISMRWPNSEESINIVDSFIRNYIILCNPTQDVQKLAVLKKEQKKLAEELKSLLEQINALEQEFGTKSPTTLDKHQEIKSERIRTLLNKVTEWEARRIDLEDQVKVLKDSLETSNSSEEERSIEEEKLLKAKKQLTDMQDELEIARALEQRFKNMLAQEDTENIDSDRRRKELQELQEKLSFTKDRYHRIGRLIQETEVERIRPSRISVAYNAHVVQVRDMRWKVTIVLVLGVAVSTILLIRSSKLF